MTNYSCEVDAKYTPGKLVFPHFALPSTLDRAEREEAAARIVSFSQQLDKWVGVSWKQLLTMIKSELDNIQQNKKNTPFTGIILDGPQFIVNGIHELLADNFLRQEKVDGEDVFFPTTKLATAIEKFATA